MAIVSGYVRLPKVIININIIILFVFALLYDQPHQIMPESRLLCVPDSPLLLVLPRDVATNRLQGEIRVYFVGDFPELHLLSFS